MAKQRVKSYSRASDRNSMLIMVALIALVVGFVGGFFFARDRYVKRIASISTMNMEKADLINELQDQLNVLGASTKAD